jgi:hypothetical protein
MKSVVFVLIDGIAATAFLDAWSLLRRQLLGAPLPDYRLVGRWIAHMRRGRFRHDAIARAEPIRGETLVGWTFHYGVGVVFAALLPAIWGSAWMEQPAVLPALLVGIATVCAPFFILQPAMGAGFAASRTPRPNAARAQSLLNHGIFGFGLYLGAVAIHQPFTGV